MPLETQKPQGQEEQLYTPPGPQPIVFEDFSGGLNTNSTRPGIKDGEEWWCDGFFPIAPNYLRTIPDVGTSIYTAGSVVPPGQTTVIWAVTNSCKFLPYPLGATGAQPPLTVLTDVDPVTTWTLFNIDVDSAGTRYMMRYTVDRNTATLLNPEIDIFDAGIVGDPAAITRSITDSTHLPSGNSTVGGICLDDTQTHIYVCNSAKILKYPVGASGDTTGTVIVTTSGVIFTSIFFDTARQLLWVSCGGGDGPGIRAYDLSGTLQRNISCTMFWSPSLDIDSVVIDGSGNIYGASGSELDDNSKFASIVYVFDAAANGDSVPLRRIQLEGADSASFPCSIQLGSDGNLYQCFGGSASHVISVPANGDGIFTSAQWTTDLTGAGTLLDATMSGGITDQAGVQGIRIINHYP